MAAGERAGWKRIPWKWGLPALVAATALSTSAWVSRVPEVVPLSLAEKRLVEADSRELLYSLELEDPRGNRVDAYLRAPREWVDPGAGAMPPRPAVVLVAGRFTGREAVKKIPGPLGRVMLAVEYPQAIPVRVSVWEWARSLPSIRRSALRMPGILRGAAHYLAGQPGVDASRIALVGVSFGVPFAAAAGKDPVFHAVALHYGGSNLASLFRANLPVENRWVRGGVAGFAGWWFRAIDPDRHIAEISPTPLLLISATADDLVPHAAAERLATRARPPVHQIWLPYGHLRPGEADVIREVADSTFHYFDIWVN